jgi:Lrp/AsnC family leucine-responsive transcriptional regulator
MDEIDLKILDILLENGRISYSDIADKIKLSVPSTRDRVLKLQNEGIIRKFKVEVNYGKMGFVIRALMFVALSVNAADVTPQLEKIPNILRCSAVAGREDLFLEIIASSHRDLLNLTGKIRSIDGVVRTTSNILLCEYFSQAGITNIPAPDSKQVGVSGLDQV